MKEEHFRSSSCDKVTLYRLKYLIIKLGGDIVSNTIDGLELSVERLSVEVGGEGDPLQVGEMTVLHQPDHSLDICQGE